ncbi:MAG: hypothetical protein AUG48_10845 [Actinobacteria bacterium 13_1_20CM_3_68_9]|nr:MAG: hypothetical protein AUG48_10845 [Actinobacteria bacterium 13_1_20CM_3_68_9]
MVTRVQRDYLSQPTTGGEPTGIDGNGLEALEDGVADWAQPWGPTCLLQLQADLHVFDGKLKSARRWLSARRRRQAEASAGERFVEIMARMGASLKAAEFAVPSWASSAQAVSRKTAARRTAPNPASRPGAPQRVASRRAEPRPVAPGPSSTQSRRVIAYRTRIHGFESIDQLDEVPGFPKKVRDQLRHQLTV